MKGKGMCVKVVLVIETQPQPALTAELKLLVAQTSQKLDI